jgi:hypothetical protein
MNQKRTALLCRAATVMIAAGMLAGCASTSADIKPNAAATLQARVLALSQQAANKDFDGAAKTLDGLTNELKSAAAKGDISLARDQDITTAIDLIRADLAAKAPTPTTGPSSTIQAPTPAIPAPAPGGNGKGKGKGEGHGKDG